MPLAEHQQAPDFSLPDAQGELRSLSSLLKQGRVLLYFYPKAMTPGCTVQACGLRDSNADLAALGVQVVGVSIDAPKRLAKFIEKEQLNFLLLGDEDHQVADAYAVWGPKKFMGKEYDGLHRISFLIEQDGKISKVFDQFKTSNHHQVVLDHLRQS
ncbi:MULTISPECIES: thioredoxin-dependent thiol peroxidase [Rheinheimera]|uniref:thioredoxin-dependent peroxiredoxin n=1 Tax=Rheinheimera marina TaxID=1774958 RepID=A0ABV9JR04_9GAMM